MKEIRIYVRTQEKEIEKCINILDTVLTALFDTEDIVITTDEVNNHIGGKLDDFLKEENIEIRPSIVFLREKFKDRLHIEEISYGVFAPIKINIKGYLPKEQAEEIFYNIIPICHIWTYRQDKRIKQFKYVWRQESEDN